MRRWISTGLALAALACSDDGPLAPGREGFDFTVIAPRQIPSKTVVNVEVRVLAARVEYPLVVQFEKAFVDGPFHDAGLYFLYQGDRGAVARVPVRLDMRIRVTVRESSPDGVAVSKTIAIDVADSP
jgi:hypothetical protein